MLIHFTRNANRRSNSPFIIKEKTITLSSTAKILRVVMNSKLRYTQHVTKATTRGLCAAMTLRRLRLVSSSTARQLFEMTVAPVMNYASSV